MVMSGEVASSKLCGVGAKDVGSGHIKEVNGMKGEGFKDKEWG